MAAGRTQHAGGMALATRAPTHELDLVEAAALTPAEVLTALGSRNEGLTPDEVQERLRRFGSNALAVHRVHATAVLFRQIRNPILILLLGAALVSGLTGGGTNAVIIAVIVFLSVGLGFFNEYRAAIAMESLRAQIRQEAEVRRNGGTLRVPVTDLVPGDVVALRIGGLVPADLRLLIVDQCECDEGILTGESMPVVKAVAPVTGHASLDQPGCAFMGTIVHEGSAQGVVVQTGARTAFGQIAAGMSERQGQTAFEVGLSRFSRFLFGVAAALTAFIFIVNVALSRPLIEALLFSLAIAVGIAPEMMPAIVTVSLSSGSKALAAKKVLVKRLVAIEDLGNIEILFTDKTGTLTEGMITYERAIDPSGQASEAPLLLGLLCNEAAVTEHGPVGGTRWTRPCGLLPRPQREGTSRSPPPGTCAWASSRSTMSGNWRRCWSRGRTEVRSSSPKARRKWSWTGACTSPTARARPWKRCSPKGPGWSRSPAVPPRGRVGRRRRTSSS